MSKKLTICEQFEAIIEAGRGVLSDEQIAFLEGRAEAVATKNANRKPTKAQKENEILKGHIMDFLRSDGAEHTVGEVLKALCAIPNLTEEVPTAVDLTNQRVSALMTQFKNAGEVTRTEVKGKAMFKVAEGA